MRPTTLLLFGALPLLPWAPQDADPPPATSSAQEPLLDPLAARALLWAQQLGPISMDLFEGEELVERVLLGAREVRRGERRLLELKERRLRPPNAEHARELVTWLALEPGLTPVDIWLFEAGPQKSQQARLGVEGGKLTGKVLGKGIVRNIPAPVVTDMALMLHAALLERKQGASLTLTHITFDKRGVVVTADQRLTHDGQEERDGESLTRVLHKTPRGRPIATWWLDAAGRPVAARFRGRAGLDWRRTPEPEDDEDGCPTR